MALLNQFVVLADNGTDDTPLLSASDGGVSEVGQATDNTVSADNSLLRFDDDWFFVPNEWFLKNFEDLVVNNRSSNVDSISNSESFRNIPESSLPVDRVLSER